MTYATLMVHLELGHSNAGLLKVACDLAARCGAGVTGIAACQSLQISYGEVYVSGDIIEQARAELEDEIREAEAEFRAALKPCAGPVEWRATLTFGSLADYLTAQARSADLFVTGVDQDTSVFDTSRHVNIGDLVMQMGRPVLVIPAQVEKLVLTHALVGWKDSRESRRAIMDALPLLKKSAHVSIVEIAAEEDLGPARAQLQDVVAWLGRHGVAAEWLTASPSGEDASALNDIAQRQGADLVVAGAYGHSRVREWALGGVTRDLLLRANRCALVSH